MSCWRSIEEYNRYFQSLLLISPFAVNDEKTMTEVEHNIDDPLSLHHIGPAHDFLIAVSSRDGL